MAFLTQRAVDRLLIKINGATGTFGAHLAAVDGVDWVEVSRVFVEDRMGLTWNPLTTQIESHDWQAELYGTISHANRIMHNLCVDTWMYISRGVFAQVPVKGATGSLPVLIELALHDLRVRMDRLEAAEQVVQGEHRIAERGTDVALRCGIGQIALPTGFDERGRERVEQRAGDLEVRLGVLIQTAMRASELAGRPGMERPYEKVKELMRGHQIAQEDVERFIDSLDFDSETAARLKTLTPATYVAWSRSAVTCVRFGALSAIRTSDAVPGAAPWAVGCVASGFATGLLIWFL